MQHQKINLSILILWKCIWFVTTKMKLSTHIQNIFFQLSDLQLCTNDVVIKQIPLSSVHYLIEKRNLWRGYTKSTYCVGILSNLDLFFVSNILTQFSSLDDMIAHSQMACCVSKVAMFYFTLYLTMLGHLAVIG